VTLDPETIKKARQAAGIASLSRFIEWAILFSLQNSDAKCLSIQNGKGGA